jgi:PAS domain S-box-containing protein
VPQSAVIVQRSILKQINSSFAELIGFETDEILNKSLFDFIAPEGLADIEKYYLSRLKGRDISKYETIFRDKNNKKILVEVNLKPTTYNGEKAEIAVIAEMENQPGDQDVSDRDSNDKKNEISTSNEVVETMEETTIEPNKDAQENIINKEQKAQITENEEKKYNTIDEVNEKEKPENVNIEKTEETKKIQEEK